MSEDVVSHGRGAAADPGFQHAGPTVPRMILGAHLRRLREAQHITGVAAGEVIRASHSKISRLEMGRTGFKQRDVADLLTYYGITDEAERTTLLALAEQGNTPGWWHVYHEVVPSWLNVYLGMEQAARLIRGYQLQFVPGLLQTEEYARDVLRLCHTDITEEHLSRRVELRMKRQRILRRSQPPQLWVVIDEAALRRPMGSVAAMRRQLAHLLECAELPHITIQVMPFSTGGHPAVFGPITLLRPPADDLPDLVYLEQPTGGVYPDKPAEIERYRHVMNRLAIEAEPPRDSPAIIHRMLREF